MQNLLHRILKALNVNGRDWVAMLLALLLAFSIWLIYNLALKYNGYLKVPVVAECEIDGHSAVSSNRCEVIANCRATGYKVLYASINENKPVHVTFRPSDISHKEGDLFYIPSTKLIEYSNSIYGADVQVDYFLTDTLFFSFPYENCKKVPVIPSYSLKYRDQYMADGVLKVDPDSVLVYGEPYHIENIEAVNTKPIRYSDVSDNLSGVVQLDKINGVRFSTDNVSYSVDVKRFIELKFMVPIKSINVPSDKIVSFIPSVVQITLRCRFPLIDDPQKGVTVVADYSDINRSIGGKCLLKPIGLPEGIIDYKIEPVAVSFVIENKK